MHRSVMCHEVFKQSMISAASNPLTNAAFLDSRIDIAVITQVSMNRPNKRWLQVYIFTFSRLAPRLVLFPLHVHTTLQSCPSLVP